jgi:hypothetical protein
VLHALMAHFNTEAMSSCVLLTRLQGRTASMGCCYCMHTQVGVLLPEIPDTCTTSSKSEHTSVKHGYQSLHYVLSLPVFNFDLSYRYCFLLPRFKLSLIMCVYPCMLSLGSFLKLLTHFESTRDSFASQLVASARPTLFVCAVACSIVRG